MTSPTAVIRQFWMVWNEVARHIVQFGVRVLTGDFNMALWSTVVELRARGLQANLAAWYPWKNHLEAAIRMDSCCIVVIGPAMKVRMMYDPTVLCEGISATELPEGWENTKEILRGEDGKETGRAPWKVPVFDYIGQGYALKSYRPQVDERKKQMVHWSCTPALQQADSAVVEIISRAQGDKAMWPWAVADIPNFSDTWLWPALPPVKQKPVDVNLFDPQKRMFRGRGAPLMVILGHAVNNPQVAQCFCAKI